MPSSAALSDADARLADLLSSARPFIRGELEKLDPKLPSLIAVLRSVGAGECWHKHGSFLDHLIDIYKILKLWKVQDAVCLCGLFHSAYSNSYVNLAIFDPSTGRETVRAHVGHEAERLIHLFCVVPRQPLIHDDLLFKYEEGELIEQLKQSESSLVNAKERGVFDKEEAWRRKLNSIVPADGVVVKHIKTGDDLRVSRRIVAVFLMMTIADFSDQLFGFQDVLFENSDGKLEFSGNNINTLWPGDGKPGLWMTSLSKMAAIYSLLVREEQLHILQRNSNVPVIERDEQIDLVTPPVFQNCSRILPAADQISARDFYWEAMCDSTGKGLERAEELLLRSIEKNPFVGEPRIALGQFYLVKERFEEAHVQAQEGLRLLLEWGSPWDKRMSWEGWVAWARVLVMKAREKTWPDHAWGILNLGLVR
uniref:DUF6817 domain-containing protein n=1 Tax=Kalanchoe fedtschenkoi TaxID=63787 RepID=A0A7N0T3W7_KALFE